MRCLCSALMLTVFLHSGAIAQEGKSTSEDRKAEIARGSSTAKGGFENEDEICDKFNNWKSDTEAQAWLKEMDYDITDVVAVKAAKPHGEKADVEVRVTTKDGEKLEGISTKLVSNPNGFNQIDKRWLANYAKKWSMPDDVHQSLKLFCGETRPGKAGRDARRMFLDEMTDAQQQAVVDFFTSNREQIVFDLFAGDGEHAAGWMMVTLKTPKTESADNAKQAANAGDPELSDTEAKAKPPAGSDWVLVSTKDVIRFYGEGPVVITRAGSLKIGRITMQRKGGDNGRESANMLQFKINPVDLFELKTSLD